MIAPDLLNQLVELTGNTSNAFAIALYKVDLDGDLTVVVTIGLSSIQLVLITYLGIVV